MHWSPLSVLACQHCYCLRLQKKRTRDKSKDLKERQPEMRMSRKETLLKWKWSNQVPQEENRIAFFQILKRFWLCYKFQFSYSERTSESFFAFSSETNKLVRATWRNTFSFSSFLQNQMSSQVFSLLAILCPVFFCCLVCFAFLDSQQIRLLLLCDGIDGPLFQKRWKTGYLTLEFRFLSETCSCFPLFSRAGSNTPRLFVVCYVQKWIPCSLQMALHLESFRAQSAAPYAQICILDADSEQGQCWEIG